MKALRFMLVIFEIIVLFGPATIFLFMSPIGVFAAAGSGSGIGAVLMVALAGCGALGMYSVINLAAHSLHRDHRLPKRSWLLLGVVSGITACVGVIVTSHLDPILILIFGAPVLGTLHLLWLCREALRTTA